MNNVAPLQGMAENLAQHGRYGDSMLVHMNPIEVQGIASLMPNGQLPLNPVTGQPEAFAFLAPLLGGFLGKALLANTLGNAALASALGSGVLTAAVEKDLGKGLAAGLMSFAGSKILGAGQQAGVQESIQEGLGQSGIDAASLQLQNVGGEQVLKHLVEDETGKTVAQQLTEQQINKLGAGGEQGLIDLMQQSSTLPEVAAGTTNPFAAAGAEFMNPRTALPFAIGASEYVRKDLDSSLIDEESDDDLMLAEQGIDNAMRQRIYDYGFPAQGIAPRDPRFAPNQMMAAGGGLVSLNPAQYADKKNGLARLMGEPVRMQIGGSLPDLGQYQGYSLQPSASEAQSGLRGTQAISAPQMQALTASGYRAGFDPELQYFRTPDRFGNDPFPEVFDPRNPNAPVLPTNAQLAQELAEAEASGAGAGTADSAALYGMPSYVSPDGAYSRFLGGTLGSGIAGVPTMGQNYDTNQGIAALQGLDYSDYPKRSDFGPADEGGHIEYQQAQQEWFRNRMPSARIDQPVMPSEATSPVVPIPPPASPTSRAEQLQYQIDMLTKGTRSPNAEEQARADQLQAELDAMRQASPLMPPPVVGRPTEPPPPVEQPPVSNEKLQRILADRPRRGEYDSPYDFITDLRDFRGINPFNKGGLVKMQDMGQVPEMLIDPALEDPAMADPMANIDPETQQLLEQAAMAILGQVSPEEADAIIQAFIERFGPEVFQQFRNQVLTAVVPNAQTEGMVEGQGDGMSDEIMGMIGDQQQVAVSPGEYIVPADVVSGIGNGSSDAGANELDRMLADIRQARTGMTEQPPEIDPRGAMPA
tara:strand:- start:19319 stop:21760 length:2442 start_codon:yes stop_codon:yes gene_type:complete